MTCGTRSCRHPSVIRAAATGGPVALRIARRAGALVSSWPLRPGTGRAPNICAAREDSAIPSYKRRHRTIQRVGDGAKQFGFSDLQNAVAGDRMGAGVEHERPKLWRRLSEVIQGTVDLRKIAFVTTAHRDMVRVEAQPFQAGSIGRPGLLAILLSHMRERGKKNGAVFNQRLEDVILHDHFLSGAKLGIETTTRHFLKRVFEQIN